MKSILEEILTHKVNELKKQRVHGQKILNMIKGDPLHLIVLNYLYSHKIYKNCVMYGGSALKIVYGLPRMSVDLDFQVDFPFNREGFEKDITAYFQNKYGYEKLGINTGTEDKETVVVKVTFSGLDKLKLPDVGFTTLKVRLDFNKFETGDFQQTLIPKRNEYYNFNLRTYPVSTLMASKIAAVLNRVQYGMSDESGKSVLANYKGRDIYDLIWYLKKGIIPNLKYLEKKGHVYPDYPSLFRKIKERLANLGDGGRALRADLTHLYLEPDALDEWMSKWDEFFLDGLQNYSPIKLTTLKEIKIWQDFDTDHFIFKYYFNTDHEKIAFFRIDVSDIYIEDFQVKGFKRNDITSQIVSKVGPQEVETTTEYAGLFYSKIEDFLKRINRISPQSKIQTKFIQYKHEAFDPDTSIVLTSKELEACQLEDLL